MTNAGRLTMALLLGASMPLGGVLAQQQGKQTENSPEADRTDKPGGARRRR